MSFENNCIDLNISFSFNNENPFFQNMNLKFYFNKINFITGKNGTGKTMFFNILQNKIQKSHNSNIVFKIDDKEYNFFDKNFLKNIKFLSSDFKSFLIEESTVYENIYFSSFKKFPFLFNKKNNFKYLEILKEAQIKLEQKVKELSNGQKIILLIIMTLQKNISIIFMDEPTALLDNKNSKLIFNFLKKVCIENKIAIISIEKNKNILNRYIKEYYEIIKTKDNVRKSKLIKI